MSGIRSKSPFHRGWIWDVRRENTVAEGRDPEESFDESAEHRLLVWQEFLLRAVEAGNKAIEWLSLEDIDTESLSDSEIENLYEQRWSSTGDVVVSAYNFLWPEIESMVIKLGVPFLPEIEELHNGHFGHDEDYDDDFPPF